MAAEDNNYVVGKGRVLFNRFLDGTKTPTGERYLGNTPEFTLSQSEETLDHFDADGGLRVKDASVTLSQDTSGGITCDNISAENLALWWLGDVAPTTIAANAQAITEVFAHVLQGTYLQLGATSAMPQGAGNVTGVTVSVGGQQIAALNNWEVDLNAARLYVLPNAPGIPKGSAVSVTYTQGAYSAEQVIAKGRSLYGSLRFIATNPVGTKRDAFMPYVKIAPDGDYSLKGEDWQTMSFSLDILKLNTVTERVYWTTRPG